jgi:hypothetical protein
MFTQSGQGRVMHWRRFKNCWKKFAPFNVFPYAGDLSFPVLSLLGPPTTEGNNRKEVA